MLGTSKSTINRIRHDLRFSYRPLRHAPRLNDRQIQARLAFCRAHQNDDWERTLFTDESRFATSPDCPVMEWVQRGERHYVETEKFPASFMVWGGIVGDRKTPLLECPRRLNAQRYIEMLETNGVVEFVQRCDDGIVFQQDGAR